eukprot:3029998-Pleurochrysis_carterae.AAC.2
MPIGGRGGGAFGAREHTAEAVLVALDRGAVRPSVDTTRLLVSLLDRVHRAVRLDVSLVRQLHLVAVVAQVELLARALGLRAHPHTLTATHTRSLTHTRDHIRARSQGCANRSSCDVFSDRADAFSCGDSATALGELKCKHHHSQTYMCCVVNCACTSSSQMPFLGWSAHQNVRM